MMIRMVHFAGAALLTLLACGGAVAHHSGQAFYDSGSIGEFEGEVTTVFWRNPHVQFTVRRDGSGEIWELESNSVNTLIRMGITSAVVGAGDRVRVAGLLSRHGLPAMRVTNVLLPDGREVVLMPNIAEARWSESGTIATATATAAAPAPGREPEGLFRIWTAGMRPNTGDSTAALPLTDAARRQREAWDPLTDDPALRCIAPGMPGMMSNPYPIEFVRQGQDLLLRLEEWDGSRTIHMNADPAEAREQPTSPAGYSTGRWQDDTLVVTTTRIDWPYFDDFGTPQSTDVRIVERFTLSEDETRLDYRATVTDPATFTEPVVLESYWHWVPGEDIKPYRCALRESSR